MSARVTAIIPTYNCARYLPAAIESALRQTLPPAEVLVVDDGSTDDTAAVVARFGEGIRYLRQEHSGVSAARNLGVREARSEMIAFLDADDLWMLEKTALQIAALETNPSVAIAFGQVEEFHSEELTEEERSRLKLRPGRHPGILAQTMLISRADFLRVGEFSPAWRLGEFMDWYLKAREQGLTALTLAEVVLRRRLHRGNLGIRERDSRADYLRILKSSLDRRRQPPDGAGA